VLGGAIFSKAKNYKLKWKNNSAAGRGPRSNFHHALYSILERRPCTSIICLHSTTPTKLLMALNLNLPPEDGDGEAIPELNGDVDEEQYLGSNGVQQDHVQGGRNPADAVQGDVLEGGNPEIQDQPEIIEEGKLH
jgi:hypothetical protein